MNRINMIGLLDMRGQENIRRVYGVDGIAPTLTTSQGGHRQPKILIGGNGMGNRQAGAVYDKDGISPTVKTPSGGYSQPMFISDRREEMIKLKVNDFFCGAGGMGLGFKNAGLEIAGAWDFDKFAVESYKHNVGDHVEKADITEMDWTSIPFAHCWTFGFPCQDLSVAGKRAGLIKGETRSGLFYEVMRLLEETEQNEPSKLPMVIMAENVKGLKPFLPVLEEEYKARGYKLYLSNQNGGLFNSKFWGVPQNRERYFVVGVHESIEKEFVFPIQQEHYVPRLSSVLESEVDEKYYIDDVKAKKVIDEAKRKIDLKGLHACLTPDRPKRQNGPRAKSEELESYTLTAQDKHGVIESNFKVRKLTPREYARLQGFPESYEQIVSDSQFYKQMGNAVTVNVAQAMAERIRMFLLSL